MIQLTPYLNFDGKCKEAMTFYQSCFGGELTSQTVGESPMAAQQSAETQAEVLHSALVIGGQNFIFGSDMMDAGKSLAGNTIILNISSTDKAEVTKLYEALLAGGTVGHPLKDEFFGMYGDLIDQFGMRWSFQASSVESNK